ncbi:hypothetical protein SDC9_119863 [bioreactor metagenome]|uniref:Uncharacterized protein n=1 Tax=bioreactor metagenome TaxID=1076179 RepID=A0A645C6V0_9ZZZZ
MRVVGVVAHVEEEDDAQYEEQTLLFILFQFGGRFIRNVGLFVD